MSGVGDIYTVTVSRINEGGNEAPFITLPAQTVTLHPDGSLSIQEGTGGRTYSAGSWNEVTVKRERLEGGGYGHRT
jgi:hypothetical protein